MTQMTSHSKVHACLLLPCQQRRIWKWLPLTTNSTLHKILNLLRRGIRTCFHQQVWQLAEGGKLAVEF
uniref:Uncharacterized protein n=1 Tax=Anguilla anguilla TaxID=7936 RepID=A0A0E9TP75_ANGAN